MFKIIINRMNRFFRTGLLKGLLLTAGALFTFFMSALFIINPHFLSMLELKVYDSIFRSSYSDSSSKAIIIVDIDEQSLSQFGQWPWPRYRVALMLEKIRRDGAASIGLDIIFAEEDRTSPKIVQQQLLIELGVEIGFTGLPQGLEDNDQILANILKNGPFTLGYYFDLYHEVTDAASKEIPSDDLHPVQLAVVSTKDAIPLEETLFHAGRITGNIPALSTAAPRSGFLNVSPDPDGIIRRVPLLMSYKEEIFPSLALGALLNVLDSKQVLIRTTSGGPESMRVGSQQIPLDSRGQLLLNYRGPAKSFKYVSAGDILQDKVPPGTFEGKIVFVGTSAAGLKDIRSTPLDHIYPGVEAHATIIDNILTGDFLQRPDWALGLELSTVIAAGAISTLFLAWIGGVWIVIPIIFCAAGAWWGSQYFFQNHGLYFSPFMPLLTLVGNFSLLTFLKFWLEEREKRKIRNTFEHYLSPEVIKKVIKNPGMLKLGGEKKNISILFTDIRSFTNLSEAMEPQELVTFMNEYLTAMTEVILRNKGTLDKYMGDAIMAFFGAPGDMQDHALIAQRTALEMLENLNECRKKWCSSGFSKLEIGVGISSGEVIVGNMGSEKRFDYTVMGDQVNLASRLEGLTKSYGVKVLVSEFTRNQAMEEITYREIDLVRVKGKDKPVAVYEPLLKDYFSEGRFDFIPPFEQGIMAYRNQNWEEAINFFNQTLTIKPEDNPSLIYIERCKKMAASPPGPGWDGVWVMTSK